MVDSNKIERYDFNDLLALMEQLRGEGGCPWDREQTHQSIRRNFIEEVYEACEAIDNEDNTHLCEELGDVLLQVVFHAHIAQSDGAFDMTDVTDGICRKLILRHPHIFGEVSVSGSAEVLDNWEEIKRREKQQETYTQAMDEVAKSLPALIYAEKMQKRARKAGFDWDDVSGALDKVREETDELASAIKGEGNAEEELGDLLFAAVNVARFLEVDPEEALRKAARKFHRRFARVEEMAGDALKGMSLAEMDKLWDKAKLI
ncbi:MAG: nucleoside triphosphate pyrophosphohydrolase [Clostridium sp. SCN 57-10]|nr:MAG: nucleoside triphosphate pyrophosphohydrolase [Clostridium sp. SCN 57-10]